jgi:hypothetical protein
MMSSGMLRRVALVRTDVSEELSASFIRVRIGELGTTLALTSNRRTYTIPLSLGQNNGCATSSVGVVQRPTEWNVKPANKEVFCGMQLMSYIRQYLISFSKKINNLSTMASIRKVKKILIINRMQGLRMTAAVVETFLT